MALRRPFQLYRFCDSTFFLFLLHQEDSGISDITRASPPFSAKYPPLPIKLRQSSTTQNQAPQARNSIRKCAWIQLQDCIGCGGGWTTPACIMLFWQCSTVSPVRALLRDCGSSFFLCKSRHMGLEQLHMLLFCSAVCVLGSAFKLNHGYRHLGKCQELISTHL